MSKINRLTLIIGVPGTGKSTLAKRIKELYAMFYRECVIHEADDFFCSNGDYKFSPENLPEAHKTCQAKTYKDLSSGKDVIVANTNLRMWERKPYFDMARKLKLNVDIIILDKIYGNVHGVPENKVEAMKKKFEPINSDELIGIDTVKIDSFEKTDNDLRFFIKK